jgi:hypothetical protein
MVLDIFANRAFQVGDSCKGPASDSSSRDFGEEPPDLVELPAAGRHKVQSKSSCRRNKRWTVGCTPKARQFRRIEFDDRPLSRDIIRVAWGS